MADFIQEQGSTASYEGNQYVELAGTSQEAKPTGDFLSGSVFVEVDTGKVFLYDRGSSEWYEIAGSGGGGGGGTNVVANPTLAGTEADLTGLQVGDTKYKVGSGVLMVHGEMDYDVNPVAIKNVDASVADIVAFVRGGGMAFFEISEENIYPCVTAWLDDPYDGTIVMFSYPPRPLPGESSLSLFYQTITGVSGTPDTWTFEEESYDVALASS